MSPKNLLYWRRKADKVRLLGWLNVLASGGYVYLSSERLPAVIAACFWIIVVFAVTQAIAWHMEKKAAILDDRRGH